MCVVMCLSGWKYLPWEERTTKQEEEEAEARKQEGEKGVRFDAQAFAKARGTSFHTLSLANLKCSFMQDGTLKALEDDALFKEGRKKNIGPLLAVELLMLSGEWR